MVSKLTLLGATIALTLLIVNGAFAVSEPGSVIVETIKGKLEGLRLVSRSGKSYSAFKGIPYATKPKRFQVAVPHPPWDDVRKATEFGNACPHFDFYETKSIIGDEDCLFLNVYTPEIQPQSKLPVMVWIHPGAFEIGRSDDFEAKYLIDEDVILVTLNYRLGALGFLYLEDDSVPGNLGLKDQNLALNWVKENIEAFGGDSARVTLFGASAGAASVHFHILSPMSQGLFQNAISQSGSALCPWAIQKSPESTAVVFAQKFDCPTDDYSSLLFCLSKKTSQEIVEGQMKMQEWFLFPFSSFAPVIETDIAAGSKFLTEEPDQIIASGNFNRVPWIVGFAEDEGAIFSAPIIMNENRTEELNEKFEEFAPIMLLYYDIYPKGKRDNISEKIFKSYFGPEEISEETWSSLTDLISDRYFLSSIDKSARLHATYSPVYPYIFAFAGGDPTLLRSIFGITGDHGVVHVDELQYLFNGTMGSPEYTEEKQHEPLEFSRKFVTLWTNFAKTSVPTHTWKEKVDWNPIPSDIGNSSINYLEIAVELKISDTDYDDRFALWNELSLDQGSFFAQIVSESKDEL